MAGMGFTINTTVLITANTKDITISIMVITITDMGIVATVTATTTNIAMPGIHRLIEHHILKQERISSIQMMVSCWFTSLTRRELAATDVGKGLCIATASCRSNMQASPAYSGRLPSHGFVSLKKFRKEIPGMGVSDFSQLFGCSGCDDFATTVTAFGAKVYDPVSRFDDIQIVFDDHHGVAMIAQAVQYMEQLLDVMEV
jgi:hypothetical protein